MSLHHQSKGQERKPNGGGVADPEATCREASGNPIVSSAKDRGSAARAAPVPNKHIKNKLYWRLVLIVKTPAESDNFNH